MSELITLLALVVIGARTSFEVFEFLIDLAKRLMR